jgi:cytochrome c biogenesis protein
MGQNDALSERIYQFFASVRLGLFLFGALAATSVIGTLIPQESTVEQRLLEYGPKLSALIELLDLADMYHSWWFKVLVGLLGVNIIVCSLRRLPQTLTLMRSVTHTMDPSRLEKMRFHERVQLPLPVPESQKLIGAHLSRRYSLCRWLEREDGWQAMAEKGRLTRLAVYFVHLGVLLILGGALVGSIFGFRGFVTIPEQGAVDRIFIGGKHRVLPLGFAIRCDKFTVDFYETGAPKEFRSDVSILDQGQVVDQAAIRVNEPFTFRRVTFYQATYGSEPSAIVLKVKDLTTGATRRLQVPFRETLTIPGTEDRLVVMDYAENVRNHGPALLVAVARENQQPASAWILTKQPDFHGNRINDLALSVESFQNSFYTGLQVKKDPGVWVIYLGFTLMLLSMLFALYGSHRRLWFLLSQGASGTKIILGGHSSKHQTAFEREFRKLTREVADLSSHHRNAHV